MSATAGKSLQWTVTRRPAGGVARTASRRKARSTRRTSSSSATTRPATLSARCSPLSARSAARGKSADKMYYKEEEFSYAGWESSMTNDDMLIGRADRDRYNSHLSMMYADKYLTHEEFEQRTNAVAKARTLGELKKTAVNLPLIAQELTVPEKPGEFYSQVLNDTAKVAAKVPPIGWSLAGMFVSLGTTIGGPGYFSRFFSGVGNNHRPLL